jgi:hypothetical protein
MPTEVSMRKIAVDGLVFPWGFIILLKKENQYDNEDDITRIIRVSTCLSANGVSIPYSSYRINPISGPKTVKSAAAIICIACGGTSGRLMMESLRICIIITAIKKMRYGIEIRNIATVFSF